MVKGGCHFVWTPHGNIFRTIITLPRARGKPQKNHSCVMAACTKFTPSARVVCPIPRHGQTSPVRSVRDVRFPHPPPRAPSSPDLGRFCGLSYCVRDCAYNCYPFTHGCSPMITAPPDAADARPSVHPTAAFRCPPRRPCRSS